MLILKQILRVKSSAARVCWQQALPVFIIRNISFTKWIIVCNPGYYVGVL